MSANESEETSPVYSKEYQKFGSPIFTSENATSTSLSTLFGHNADFMFRNDTNGTDDISESYLLLILIMNCILAIVVSVANVIILVASKFVKGSGNSTLVFMRSVCFADTMVGIFGVSKTVHMMFGPGYINCFLGESLLFSSIFSANLTLLAYTYECYNKLAQLACNEPENVDRKTKISGMMFMWNGAFIVGFMPLMGWNRPDRSPNYYYTCAFFEFYNSSYLFLIVSIFGLCLGGAFILHIYIEVFNHRTLKRSCFLQLKSAYTKVRTEIYTVRFLLVSELVMYLPVIVFILLHCDMCSRPPETHPSSSIKLFYFVPLILLKSLITAIFQGSRSKRIWNELCEMSRIRKILLLTSKCKSNGDTINRSHATHQNISVSVISASADNDTEPVASTSTVHKGVKLRLHSHYDDQNFTLGAINRAFYLPPGGIGSFTHSSSSSSTIASPPQIIVHSAD